MWTIERAPNRDTYNPLCYHEALNGPQHFSNSYILALYCLSFGIWKASVMCTSFMSNSSDMSFLWHRFLKNFWPYFITYFILERSLLEVMNFVNFKHVMQPKKKGTTTNHQIKVQVKKICLNDYHIWGPLVHLAPRGFLSRVGPTGSNFMSDCPTLVFFSFLEDIGYGRTFKFHDYLILMVCSISHK